jgi:signal transduction histidine kinase
LNKKSENIRNYNVYDGLQGMEFAERSHFKNKITGELFFGGIHGFNSFFPQNIKDNTFLPKVVITDLKISNQHVPINKKFRGNIILTKSILLTKEITLPYNYSNITIEFAGLHYSNPQCNKYLYMLEKFDSDWIQTDASMRLVNYSYLLPGTYIFKVKASNNDGVWNQIPAKLTIIVLPPWWKSWWFRFILIFTILCLIYLMYYLRIAFYRKRENELKILVRKRTVELEEINKILLVKQEFIEKQSEELRTNSEDLKNTNDLLMEKQGFILKQSELLKESNHQLSILNATKDKFFSIIAHDLRNPFNIVTGFSDLLLKKINTLPQEKITKYLEMIHSSSTKGNNLLENLLQWSRNQTGSISFNPIKLNLFEIVEEATNFFRSDIERKNIIISNLIDHHITILADDNMIKTIFRNLISNATKFTHDGGRISLSSNVIDSLVELSVTDTGVGIPDKDIVNLFQIDFSLTTKGTANETGTGLGLILCKEFIEKHNGKIFVESKVGKGTTFKFTLPTI